MARVARVEREGPIDPKDQAVVAARAGTFLPSVGALDSRELNRNILIVEDDPLVSQVVEEILTDFGYNAATAGSGADAMTALHAQRPDLILLDLSLPDMDGLELCRRLRRDPRWDAVPIIALTARGQLSDRVAGLREGLDDYLTKPFSISELSARVDANLRRSQRELHTSPLTLLPGNRAIEAALATRLASGRDFAVCYVDIDNFKPYNDRYGFAAGDRIIQTLADIIQQTISETRNGFPGHIGGDDFVVVLDPDEIEAFCKQVLGAFKALLPTAYSHEDFERGGIESEDRAGTRRVFPLVGLSIAVVVQEKERYQHIGELSRAAAEIKSYLKRHGGNTYMIERRNP